MKLFKLSALASAAAFATLFAFSANAQSVGLNNAADQSNPEFSAYDCVVSTPLGHDPLTLVGAAARQTFTACATGEMTALYLNVLRSNGTKTFKVAVLDNSGNVISFDTFSIRGSATGILKLKLHGSMVSGEQYMLMITTDNDSELVLATKKNLAPEEDLTLNGWNLNGTIMMSVGIINGETEEASPDRLEGTVNSDDDSGNEDGFEDAAGLDIDVYPNPFVSDLVLRFNEDVDERVVIEMKDLYGTTVYRAELDRVYAGTELPIIPEYALLNGVYSLRVRNGTNVTTRTIIKQ